MQNYCFANYALDWNCESWIPSNRIYKRSILPKFVFFPHSGLTFAIGWLHKMARSSACAQKAKVSGINIQLFAWWWMGSMQNKKNKSTNLTSLGMQAFQNLRLSCWHTTVSKREIVLWLLFLQRFRAWYVAVFLGGPRGEGSRASFQGCLKVCLLAAVLATWQHRTTWRCRDVGMLGGVVSR